MAEELRLSEQEKVRRGKMEDLRAKGLDPFGHKFVRTSNSGKLKEEYLECSKEELEEKNVEVSIAGRIMSKRRQGKIGFMHIQDREGKIQIFMRADSVSEDDYEIWNDVINYWDYIENDMTLNTTVPNDLPTENHVFIVLGYALKEDGTMEDELVGRLQVALDTIQKYPHNYILVTGGVEQNGWSEGKRMYDWLVEHGVSQNQIIVEEQAKDTAGNASNSFEMLYTDYTNIKSCSLISSSYHIKRGSLLYYAESLLKAKELGVNPIEFIGEGNVGWEREDKDSESMIVKAISLCGIAHCMSQVKTMALSLVAFMFIIVLMLFLIIRRLRKRKNSID